MEQIGYITYSQTLLHEQVPEEQQEKYEKGQHLRGKDAELAVQVCAEMVCSLLSTSIVHSFANLACAPMSRNKRCCTILLEHITGMVFKAVEERSVGVKCRCQLTRSSCRGPA